MKTLETKAFKPFTLALLLCLSALLLAVPVLAEHHEDDDEELGQMVANASLELKVKTALIDKIGWDMIDTDVEANGGYVLLTGEAETKANRELAKEVARSVEGVTEVRNKIRLEYEDTDTPVAQRVNRAELEVKDAVLESRVKTALIGELGLTAFDIEVEASEGQVSLRGDVESKQHHELALATARDVSGVKEVLDLIEVERE